MNKKLIKRLEGITIWSENYKELATWYQEIFGMKVVHELDMPLDQAVALELKENDTDEIYLWIGYHSEVKGKSKDKFRIMISYIVDDVYELEKHLKDKNVEIIAKAQRSPDGSLNVLTAEDPEENIVQLYSFPVENDTLS